MDERDFDRDLLPIARHVSYLGKQVGIDLRHKASLRADLLGRHAELTARRRSRRFAFLSLGRGLSLTSAAVAAAVALAVVIPDVHLGGRISPQTAEAARIAMAAARTVPTVTSWQVTLHRVKGNTATATNCSFPLREGARFYTRGGMIYLFYRGKWYKFTARGQGTCARWQYQFLSLPAALASKKIASYRHTTVRGQRAEVASYASHVDGKTITVQAWISAQTGLVLRLERSVTSGGRVLERELADYSYHQSSP